MSERPTGNRVDGTAPAEGGRDVVASAPADVQQGQVQVPPVPPAIDVVWTIDEVRQLPEGAVVTWTEGPWNERRAAVIHDDDGRKFIEHTWSNIYYISDLELIEYPALALTWPAADDAAPEPAQSGHSGIEPRIPGQAG